MLCPHPCALTPGVRPKGPACDLSCVHMGQPVGLGLALGLGAQRAREQAGRRVDPVLILTFNIILIPS